MMVATNTSLRGEMRHNEMMANHTTWRVGGPAKHFYRPADIDDLACFIANIDKSEPVYFVGMGSNLLVRDGGFNGTVISTKGVMDQIKITPENSVYVEAGVNCAKVARFCARAGLKGAEFLSGIPGTFGGALAMNAGCFGSETWNIVNTVCVINHNGMLIKRTSDDFEIGYRKVTGHEGEWFVSANLQLTPGDSNSLLKRNRDLLEQRGSHQPTQLPNAGSVFKNPPADYAARLIEAAGLKGTTIGNATVSEKHANFIVNNGDATAKDIELLIQKVQQTVQFQFGVTLVPEVKIIGESGGQDDSLH